MTRGMFVTVLSRINGEETDQYINTVFSDVKESDYFSSAVAWAYSNNIVAGTDEKTFDPDLPVTREQICLMLKNYMDFAGIPMTDKNAETKYNDDASISSWAYSSVYRMQKTGYLVGSGGSFRPQDNATRAECASVFSRLCGNFYDIFLPENKDDVVLPDDSDDVIEGGTLIGVFTSTFYCPCSSCNGAWAGKTATGAPMVVGETIAVDPSVIPLGSTVYIEFSLESLQHLNGVYKATDIGGAINNYRVDVLVENHNVSATYGVDNGVKIYLLN